LPISRNSTGISFASALATTTGTAAVPRTDFGVALSAPLCEQLVETPLTRTAKIPTAARRAPDVMCERVDIIMQTEVWPAHSELVSILQRPGQTCVKTRCASCERLAGRRVGRLSGASTAERRAETWSTPSWRARAARHRIDE